MPGTTNGVGTNTSGERTPLLAARPGGETACEPDLDGHGNAAEEAVAASRRLTVIGLCLLLMILLDIGLSLLSTGLLQVQEDIICRHLQAHGDRLNDGCTDNDVQSELSIIQSWQIVFDLIPGLVMAVPLGIVADRHGRSLVLGLSLLGLTASSLFSIIVCSFPTVFPLRCVWLSAIFNFIGGSVTVFSAMIFSIAADISPEAQRSTAFFYLGAVMLGGAVIANPIVYWVMERGTWIAIYLGLGLMAFATLLGFCVPETLKKTQESVPNDNNEDDGGGTAVDVADGGLGFGPLLREAKSGTRQFRGFLYTVVREQRRVGLLLLSLLLTTFGRNAQVMLQQYVVVKFKWSWSKAGLLLSVQAFCSLLLLLIFLPAFAQLLLKILGPNEKDIWLARVSMALQVAGAITIGLADVPALLIPGVALQALGTGFNPVVRGIMTNLMMGHDLGLLFSVIAFIETVGTVIANPLLALAFRIGLGWGREWTGLPFMVATLLFTLALVIVGLMTVPETKPKPSTGTSDQGDIPDNAPLINQGGDD